MSGGFNDRELMNEQERETLETKKAAEKRLEGQIEITEKELAKTREEEDETGNFLFRESKQWLELVIGRKKIRKEIEEYKGTIADRRLRELVKEYKREKESRR